MELDFLNQFKQRMKHVGAYALLFKNSNQKQKWKNYRIESIDEQTNMLFSVLLFIMEQSLRDESCTLDDIGEFLERINMLYFKRDLSFEQHKELGDFIVNVILCDEGRTMYFEGFDYDQGMVEQLHISFVANKIIYLDGEVKRTSYYLTEEGYNLMLGTLEIESSMQLTIHEMIFRLQLEKASYDKAAEEIKNVFNRLRIQLQGMEEAMRRIRQNALEYSVDEYERVMRENMAIIDSTKEKFGEYRNYVNGLVNDLEEQQIEMEKIEPEKLENLKYLRIIEGYLTRAIDEYQKIFSTHFDLKSMYDKELEALVQMSLIRRFSIRNELYNEVLKDITKLNRMDVFLRPLFCNDMEKSYQLSKVVELQKTPTIKEEDKDIEFEAFDEEVFLRQKQEAIKRKLLSYETSLATLLSKVNQIALDGITTLGEVKRGMSVEEKEKIAPSVEVFREMMVELLKNRVFDLVALKKEQEEHFYEEPKEFQLHHCLLTAIEKDVQLSKLVRLEISRVQEGEPVVWEQIMDEGGVAKVIKCSDVRFVLEERKGHIYGI